MRNSIAWSQDYSLIERPVKGQVAVNLSHLAVKALKADCASFLLDPWKSLKAIVQGSVPPDNRRLVLHNLGILLEPDLHLAAEKFLLDLALDFDLVLFWPWAVEDSRRLVWDAARPDIHLEFEAHILSHLELAT